MSKKSKKLQEVPKDKLEQHVQHLKDSALHAKVNFKPANKEQSDLYAALRDEEVRMIFVEGRAGSGKNFVTIAAGLDLVLKGVYDKLMLFKPLVEVGKSLGFLPGNLDEKLDPVYQNFYDNISFLCGKNIVQSLKTKEKLTLEAIAFARGRSLHNSFIIIDECLTGENRVVLSSGKSIPIKKIVDTFEKDKFVVKSYNEKTLLFEDKKVLNVFRKGNRSVIELTFGNNKIKCTNNHRFLTTSGWKEAKDIKIGEAVIAYDPKKNLQYINTVKGNQEQILLGSYLGDGGIHRINKNVYRMNYLHGIAQKDYALWKSSFLYKAGEQIVEKNGYSKKQAIKIRGESFFYDLNFEGKGKNISKEVFSRLNDLGLAVWMMDDSSYNGSGFTIHCNCFDKLSVDRAISYFETMGVSVRLSYNKNKYPTLNIGKEGSDIIMKKIKPYIHPNLFYKFKIDNSDYLNVKVENTCTRVKVLTKKKDLPDKEEVYDIEVEDNHNFVIIKSESVSSGLIVHNCQNLSVHELLTLATRPAYSSKIIFLYDSKQSDVGMKSGVTKFVEHLKKTEIDGIRYHKLLASQRSPLVEAINNAFENFKE